MIRRVCIDPGHGGKDPGAIGQNGLRETDVNLAVALTVASLLQRNNIQVMLTRHNEKETFSLKARVLTANFEAERSDIFVSIHCNASVNRNVQGTETFCFRAGGQGEKLATAIHGEVIRSLGRKNRGVKAANFQVLRDTTMPAALVELAFISNLEEEEFLAQTENQLKAATAIAKGICKHFDIPFFSFPPARFPERREPLYRVQVGVFTTKAAADRMVARLRNLGIEAVITDDKG